MNESRFSDGYSPRASRSSRTEFILCVTEINDSVRGRPRIASTLKPSFRLDVRLRLEPPGVVGLSGEFMFIGDVIDNSLSPLAQDEFLDRLPSDTRSPSTKKDTSSTSEDSGVFASQLNTFSSSQSIGLAKRLRLVSELKDRSEEWELLVFSGGRDICARRLASKSGYRRGPYSLMISMTFCDNCSRTSRRFVIGYLVDANMERNKGRRDLMCQNVQFTSGSRTYL